MGNVYEDFDSEYFLSVCFENDRGVFRLLSKEFDAACDLIAKTKKESGKLMIFGNGGSAAIASHVAVDFTKAAGIRAVNFNEADLITCFSNDYGYEYWVSKALEFYADPEDTVILISSSGNSSNMVNGARDASGAGLGLITLSGFGHDNALRKFGDVSFGAIAASTTLWSNAPSLVVGDGRLFLCKRTCLDESRGYGRSGFYR